MEGSETPSKLERLILTHPAVKDDGLIGLRDEDGLTKPCAIVVLHSGYAPSNVQARYIIMFVNSKLEELHKHS
jgi:acyl-coenzyme A synthetase/AMP-(fatty) acid ligase